MHDESNHCELGRHVGVEDSLERLGREYGFSLGRVIWGYRPAFEATIRELIEQGRLGADRQEVTEAFFGLMNRSDEGCFDHVLRQFLAALNPANRWLMDLPEIFVDVVELGASLAERRLHYGVRFFEVLAEGRMGDRPESVRRCVDWVRHLREFDDELAMAFLAGYGVLNERLRPVELTRYVEAAIEIHRGQRTGAYEFLRCESKTSEAYILSITQEFRVADVEDSLRVMLKALTGDACEVNDLSHLDSDELLVRGSTTVTVSGHVYLPSRVRRFESADENRNWYMLCGVVSASMLLEKSFARIHGHRAYRSCVDLVGSDLWRVNVFTSIEYARVLRRACARWPGARRLIEWGVGLEMVAGASGPEGLLADVLDVSVNDIEVELFRRGADACVNCFDSAAQLDRDWVREVLKSYPGLGAGLIRPMGFLSDFQFPMAFSDPPSDAFVADLKTAARKRCRDQQDESSAVDSQADGDGEFADQVEEGEAARAAYVYDEWDYEQNEYRHGWCYVHHKRVTTGGAGLVGQAWQEDARKVRSVFERLKPELVRREKRLPDGDEINADLLLAHRVDRFHEPSPPVRFYEKPLVNQRDLAVLILLDVSGSTGDHLGGQAKVLDIEKRTAVVFGEGLAALGDRFAVCGFSSNGREHCDYLVYKGFDESWSGEVRGRVLAAWPRSSTRIGPALRHSGYLLSSVAARQRLIILVTDGKPMDQGYDPATRYAQHDVRMACEENGRCGIHTFAISTEENSLADMGIMFPHGRFVILPSIGQLPRLLPEIYLRLTM